MIPIRLVLLVMVAVAGLAFAVSYADLIRYFKMRQM
jgi:hypothetical protein